mmetsp:Transcript_30410/g.63686  ORF Transcript_30410/g.63686 Transcript_30410/m.63686 type:complete len:704 (-) Transcript_30410:152-2263(-)
MAGFFSKLGASSKPQEKPEKCEGRGQVMSLSKQETSSQDKRRKKKQQQRERQQHQVKNGARNPADDASSTDASSNASSVENGHALGKLSSGIVSTSRRHRADASVGPSVRSHITKSTVKSYSSKRSTRSKLSAVGKGSEAGIDSSRAIPDKGRDESRVGIAKEAPLPDTRVKGDLHGNDDASVGKKGRKDKSEDVREKEDEITRGSFSDESEDGGSGSLASTVDLNDEYTYYTEGRPRRPGVFEVCETAFSNCVNQIAAEVVSEVDPNHDIRSFIDAEDKGKKLGDAFVGAVTDTVYAIEEIPDKVAEAMNKREQDRLAAEKEREAAMTKAKEEESAVFKEVFGTDSLDPQREVIVGKDGIMVLDFTTIPEVPSDDHVVIKIEASTLSYRDCIEANKLKNNVRSSSFSGGFDVVGRIVRLGINVRRDKQFEVGSLVAALLMNGGGHAKYARVHRDDLISVPDSLAPEDVICIMASYTTAYHAIENGKKKGVPLTGATVLVTDAGSPVGLACIELAQLEGAKIVAVSHRRFKDEICGMNVWKWFQTDDKKSWEVILGKIDVVIETRGHHQFDESCNSMHPAGVIVCTMNTSMGPSVDEDGYVSSVLKSQWKSLKARYMWDQIISIDLFDLYTKDPQLYKKSVRYLLHRLGSGDFNPLISDRLSINSVPWSFKSTASGKYCGNIVCTPWAVEDVPEKKLQTKASF